MTHKNEEGPSKLIPRAKISSNSVSKNKRPTEKAILSQLITMPPSPALPSKSKLPPKSKSSAQSILYQETSNSTQIKKVLDKSGTDVVNTTLTGVPVTDLDGSFHKDHGQEVNANRRYQDFIERSKSPSRQETLHVVKKTKSIHTLIKGLSLKSGTKSIKGGK